MLGQQMLGCRLQLPPNVEANEAASFLCSFESSWVLWAFLQASWLQCLFRQQLLVALHCCSAFLHLMLLEEHIFGHCLSNDFWPLESVTHRYTDVVYRKSIVCLGSRGMYLHGCAGSFGGCAVVQPLYCCMVASPNMQC
jgi:hypothetical protein